MEMLFGNSGVENYIDVRVGSVKKLEADGTLYRLSMVCENEIPYLWRPVALYTDGEAWLHHNTQHTYVLERLLEQTALDLERFSVIMAQVFGCVRALAEYLLTPEDLVLNTDYMFWNPQTGELRIIYLPGRGVDIRQQLKGFLERLMEKFDQRDRAGLELLYNCYGRVVDRNRDMAWLEERFLGDRKEQDMPLQPEQMQNGQRRLAQRKQEQRQAETTVPDTGWQGELSEPVEKLRQPLSAPRLVVTVVSLCVCLWFFLSFVLFHDGKGNLFFGGVSAAVGLFAFISRPTSERDESDLAMEAFQNTQRELEEVVYAPPVAKLVPLTNGALSPLLITAEDAPATVGRGRAETDYRIPFPAISRVHASVYMREHNLYIRDKSSTNGTFVNSDRLPAEVERLVKKGDIVAFANEEFYVS